MTLDGVADKVFIGALLFWGGVVVVKLILKTHGKDNDKCQ